jgi:uncharacterized protein
VTSLADLLDLQDVDLALDQVRHRRAHLPERAELTRLAAEAKAAERELAGVDEARGALAERRAKAEATLAASEERAAAIQKRLFGGDVSASRDLQAMAAELDHLKSRSSTLEDAVIEVLEAADPLDTRAGELRAALHANEAGRADVEARLALAEETADTELAALAGRRSEAAARVPHGLIATYERLRSRLGGVGVARLAGNRCDGCHLTLSAVELDRVRHLAEGEVYTCEQCSRILVHTAP